MSGLAKKYGKHLFEQNLANYQPTDPLYEEYTDERGRLRRRKVCTGSGNLGFTVADSVSFLCFLRIAVVVSVVLSAFCTLRADGFLVHR